MLVLISAVKNKGSGEPAQMHRLARQSLLLLDVDSDEDVSEFVDEDSDKTFYLLPRHMLQYDCLKEAYIYEYI